MHTAQGWLFAVSLTARQPWQPWQAIGNAVSCMYRGGSPVTFWVLCSTRPLQHGRYQCIIRPDQNRRPNPIETVRATQASGTLRMGIWLESQNIFP